MNLEETRRVPLYDMIHSVATVAHYRQRKLTVEYGDRTAGIAIGRLLDMTRGSSARLSRRRCATPTARRLAWEAMTTSAGRLKRPIRCRWRTVPRRGRSGDVGGHVLELDPGVMMLRGKGW